MVESVHDFFISLLRPGNIEDFHPGSVDLSVVGGQELPNYEGVKFPEEDTILYTTQIVKFNKLAPNCELRLFSIDEKDYLEAIFIQEGYSNHNPFLSFLFKTSRQIQYKYSNEFDTFHGSSETLDKPPESMSKLQKEGYLFIADELYKYNSTEVKEYARV